MNQTTSRPAGWRRRVLLADAETAGFNLSWGAVLAGVVAMLATLVTVSLIGVAVGLGVPDATSDQPFEGLGTGLLIWAVLGLLVSLFAGGLVTGLFAGRAGFLHGVVVWSVGVLAMVLLTATALTTALGVAGNVLGAAGSAVSQGARGVAGLAGDAAGGATDLIGDQLSDVEFDGDIEEILAGTDIPELQPDYLQGQLDAAQQDVVDAGQELVTNPEDYESILDDLATSLQERAESITSEIDRDAVASSVAANTDLSEAEAEELTDDVVQALEDAEAQASEQVENAENTLAEVRTTVEQTVQDARQTVEDATDAAARAALWAFAGLVIGLIVTGLSAHLGARLMPARQRPEQRGTAL